ncbi:MAG: VOC family protein [Gammaproteobacteria bacterium]
MDNYKTILHATYIVKNLDSAKNFYCTILDMSINDERPDLPYSGLWLNVGDSQIHLLELDNPDPVFNRPEHGGRDRHVALQVKSIKQIETALSSLNINFTVSQSGRKALFCRDPDGNALEFIEL